MYPCSAHAHAALAMAARPSLRRAGRADHHLVEVLDGAFVPSVLAIVAGDTLRVVNRDGAPRTFTADDGSYDSGRLRTGEARQVVLTAMGTHGFRCTLGSQRVRILVDAGGHAVHRRGR